jgi:glycerophosphoryl diester phosphodiesterase
MTTSQSPRAPIQEFPGRRRTTSARRVFVALALTLSFVLVLVLTPDATRVQAIGVFDGLRAPGEAAFIAGHRGDRSSAPENTLPALQRALDGPMTFVETDVRISADGVPVLMHDFRVDRTTDGQGRVRTLTLRQLRKLDAGSWFSSQFAGTRIPTLDSFLALLQRTRKKALLELKGYWSTGEARGAVDIIRHHGVQDRVIIASFDTGTLRSVADVDTSLPRVVITPALPSDPVAFATLHGAIAIVTSHASVEANPGEVKRMHRAGLGLVLYTLNSTKRWRAAMDLGVDGIITDKPAKLDSWLARVAPAV